MAWKHYWAFTAPGTEWEFLGDSWEAGGFSVDGEGNPTSDANNNTVTSYGENDIESSDWALLVDAWTDDGQVPDDEHDAFRNWLASEVGLPEGVRDEVSLLAASAYRNRATA